MPARLRPTAPIAADAILVGDPGRALLLAQALLEQPKMSNHARGLWGYTGTTSTGRELTLQATGMGGPSAALVLADLAELGLRRAIRIGTCAAIDPALPTGQLLAVGEARAMGGQGEDAGIARPDQELQARVRDELGAGGRLAVVASLDTLPGAGAHEAAIAAAAADMQTATLFAGGAALGIALAAILIVTEPVEGAQLDDDALATAAARAGAAAAAVLST